MSLAGCVGRGVQCEEYEAALGPGTLEEVSTRIEDGGVHLSMPKFSFRFHASLKEVLSDLGLEGLFEDPDLSGISSEALQVSAIEHEAFIDVDEEGTEAAAATGIQLEDSHGPWIDVSRPFFFFIVDKPTGSLLFLGRVLDPTL